MWNTLRLAGVLLCLTLPAFAHDAPSGWTYDPTCCNGMDCAPIPDRGIRLHGAFYEVPLLPKDHPFVFKKTTIRVPVSRVRPSQDEDYHLCLSTNGETAFCLYVPLSM